ncbi:MAG: hypothetical protein LYZ66_06830 [Nitrososphaerales archaeon]|nr:hypothetical protein [Nitrososphaerales archaeon]
MRLAGRTLIGVVLVVVVIAGAALVSALYLLSRGGTTTTTGSQLPPGCVRPADGFLIVASNLGYNDSISHGASPDKPWPVINVTVGSTVHIVVCNTDFQTHGFQVSHYYDSSLVTVRPGQVLDVTFVADQVGTFRIYCNIFCTIHIFMQYGQLRVAQ